MQPGAGEPRSDRELAMPKDSHRGTHTQAFGQGAEDFPHAPGWGFEAIQDCAIADAEFRLAGLAFEVLDVFVTTVAILADEGMDLVIGNARR